MDRRSAGVLLLVVVLLAAAIAPNIGSHGIAGVAEPAQVPGPPGIGDCVSGPFDPWFDDSGTVSYPSAPMGPCSGPRFAEVAVVIADPAPPPPGAPVRTLRSFIDQSGSQTFSVQYAGDPNADACSADIYPYVGYFDPSAADHLAFDYWSAGPFLSSQLITPTDRQHNAGQHWLACVVFPLPRASDVTPYSRPLRDSFRQGRVLDSLGNCGPRTAPIDQDQIGCDQPHAVEIFGFASTNDDGITQQRLDLTCRQLVAQMTKLPDITAGGLLDARAVAFHDDAAGVMAGLSTKSDYGGAVCVVETKGSRNLKGTLLNVGAESLPWA